MGSQGAGRRRLPQRERLTAEDDALSRIAREAEARLAAKRAARAEAREIRMKELERQQKEIYQVQKEDSERYSHRSRRLTSASDEDERLSVGSRGSLRTNGYDGDLYGSQPPNRRSGRNSGHSGDSRFSTLSSSREEKLSQASVFQDSSVGRAQRGSTCGSLAPSEYSGLLSSGSCASSRASSARASPVVEERPEKDFTEKGSRSMPGLSAATLASLGGSSSRRGSGDTSISIDTEASLREIKELNELKDQIQDVEGKYMQGLKEMKDSLTEVEEKYKKAMVSNAQLDNEKTNFLYQVDTLKDMLLELEEELAEARRQYEEKTKDFEREKHAHRALQFQFAEVKEALRQRDEMLEEIRQLQQKQASYIGEISDLQETIEWKDKKIGALERQKEFFDSIRSERDDLREEIVKLKEEFKKHGITLNSEVATNGETSGTLNNVGHPGPTKLTKEEVNALQPSGDGTLGRTKEVEVNNEIVQNVGTREISQNTEREQHKEDTVKDDEDVEGSRPGENTEGQKPCEDLAYAECEEQIQSQSPESHETPEQVGSQEVPDMPAEGSGASRGHPKYPEDLGSEAPGPMHEQDTCNASDVIGQSENSVGSQDQENQDLKTDMAELHRKPCQGPALGHGPEAERVSGADPGGPGGGRTEKEPANQEAAEPGGAAPHSAEGAREGSVEEEGDAGTGADKPARAEPQPVPGAPTADSSQEEAPGPGREHTGPEPNERKRDRQAEASESSQKKPKNKKKKTKKKKSPVPAESLEDVGKELAYKDADRGEVEGGQGHLAAEAQEEVAEGGTQRIAAGSGEQGDCAESGEDGNEDDCAKTEGGTEGAAGDTVDLAGRTFQPPGTEAIERELGEGDTDGGTETTGVGVAAEPESPDGTSSSSLQNESLSVAMEDPCRTGSPERHLTALEATGSVGLEEGEPGDLGSETGGHAGGGSGQSKGKEDCTMS
ncbi:leucine-rich repeat flightless-interacting protein 1 isoform X7 [Heterocephalus glaber]|uniref:Leucine-rich repeat flightless-interacting protein 1 isoform X7 n=1 Tax=Heterocephalus glaber TaxID=10181 RepID=A0AAX6S1Q6_HETGA|nr:leucine-rich repeat flightless-interacting protein 1 isoform X7 [Heterocephalus glaber]